MSYPQPMHFAALASLVHLLLLSAQEPPSSKTSAPAFEVGAKTRIELEQILELEVKTVLDARTETAESRLETKLHLSLEILAALPAGGATIGVKVLRIDAAIDDASGRTTWNSDDQRAAPPTSPRADLLAELLRFKDARIEIDLDAHHRLLARRGTEDLAARLGVAADGAAMKPSFPWLWATWPRSGAREELEIALEVASIAAHAPDVKPTANQGAPIREPRVQVVIEAVTSDAAHAEDDHDAVLTLAFKPLRTQGERGAKRSLEGSGRFAFDRKTGLLRQGVMETRGMAAREATVDPGVRMRIASITRSHARMTWRRTKS